jgi:tellurite resistance protein TerC
METPVWAWISFNLFVLAMLLLDLGIFHRKAHEIKMKEALIWSAVWISLALFFNLIVYISEGKQQAFEFLTGYLIEKSLSVDNIFVFIIIFSFFRIEPMYQHKVLFWGILGALVMRALFIAGGIILLEKFHWLIYLFGMFLIFTGIKMAAQKDKKIEPEKNPVVKVFRKMFPIAANYNGPSFFTRIEGRYIATPLFVVLLMIETSDVIFAADSIPAILAITKDPFIVYTSNVFAILGLRALYFAIAGFVRMFRYLSYGLSAILIFVGVKMMLVDLYKIPVELSLGIIVFILAVSIIASLNRTGGD